MAFQSISIKIRKLVFLGGGRGNGRKCHCKLPYNGPQCEGGGGMPSDPVA
jgi:hypothetical protein